MHTLCSFKHCSLLLLRQIHVLISRKASWRLFPSAQHYWQPLQDLSMFEAAQHFLGKVMPPQRP